MSHYCHDDWCTICHPDGPEFLKKHATVEVERCGCFWCGNGPEGSEVYCKKKPVKQEDPCQCPDLGNCTHPVHVDKGNVSYTYLPPIELLAKTLNMPSPVVSKRNKLLNFHAALTMKARGVMEKKNQDYGEDGDPFRNFRVFGAFGILVRLSDKLSRLRTFVERGTYMVNDEAVEDTTMDAINYLVLLLAMLKEKEVFNETEAAEVSISPSPGSAVR